MTPKVFILAIGALLALQTPAKASDIGCDIIGELDPLFELLSEQADTFLETTVKNIQNIFGKQVTNHIESLEEGLNKVKTQLGDLAASAQQSGYDVTECVDAYEAEYKTIESVAKESAHLCIHPLQDDLEEAVSHTISEFDRISMEVNTLDLRCSACEAPECFLGVHSDAKDLLKSVPGRVQVTYDQMKKVATEIMVEAGQCLGELSSVEEKVKAVYEKTIACYNDKMSY